MGIMGVRQLAAIVVTIAVVALACVQDVPEPTGPEGPTNSPDPSSAPSPGTSDPVATCPNFVEVVETGPEPPDMGENGPIPQDQERLRPDVEAINAYGAEHPDDFASVRYENTPRVRIVVGFTDHLDEHCAALRALLAYPDEFELIAQPRTATDVERIQQEIVDAAGPRMRSVGIGAGTIHVALRADGEALAERIQAQYGDVVEIQVGLQAYPRGRQPAVDCAERVGQMVVGSPFAATLHLETPTVRSGEDFKGTATVRNRTDVPVDFESGDPMTALVYRRGTDQVVGVYDGGIGGTGLGARLLPGETIDVSIVGGTASCLAELGFALPPGEYDVRAAIDQYERPPQGDLIVRYLLSEPSTLTVTP